MSFSQQPGWVAPPPPSMGDTLNMLTSARNFQAQQAQANAYQQAIDPQTGAFDQNKFNAALVAQGTRGTWGGGAAMQQAGNATSALGMGTQEQVKAQLAQLGTLNGVLTPLMQQAGPDGTIPVEKAQAALDQAHQAGLVNDTFYNQSKAVLGRLQPGENAYPLLDSLRWTTQTAQAQLAGQTPTQEGVDLGGGRGTVYSNPYMPHYQQPSGNYVPFSPTPIQSVTPIQIQLSNGRTIPVLPANVPAFLQQNPGSSIVPNQGGGGGGRGYVPYTPTGGSGGGGPAPAPQGGGGGGGPRPAPAPAPAPAPQGGGGGGGGPAPLPVPPQPPASQPAPPQPPPRTPVAGPAGVVQPPPAPPQAPQGGPPSVGPPPQVTIGSPPLGAGAAADVGVAAAANLTGASGGSPQRQAILSDMASSLSGSKALDTGVASDFLGKWSNVVNMLPPPFSEMIPGYTRETLATLEGFHKMAEQLRQQQAGQIGGALTNDKFASALASNPNALLSTLGNLGMIHVLQGNEDAINAKNAAWQADRERGWSDADYRTWEGKYNQLPQADPRVYWAKHMSYPELQRFIGGMGGVNSAEGKTFIQHYNAAG